jgi:hypothetical protein
MALTKPDNPLDRRIAIMDLFDSGEFTGPCTAVEMVERVGGTVQGATRALRDLEFTIVRRESVRREKIGIGRRTKAVKIPRQYGRPLVWPEAFELRRRLRKMGMSAGAAKQANVTIVPERFIEQSIEEVFADNPGVLDAIKRRGVYKKALKRVVANSMLNTVSVKELAAALGEDPAVMTPGAMVGKVEVLTRVATRRQLQETG